MNTFSAIVLAAGTGSRMNSDIPKQYMELAGKPVIYYSLKAFADAGFSSIVLVCKEEEIEYCQKEIIEKYNIKSVTSVVAGGKERYHSVFAGLKALSDTEYVFIHDAARPMLTQEIITRLKETVIKEKTAVAGMPVKDTIKIVDDENYVSDTPERQYVWQVQTPQCFSYPIIYQAYKSIIQDEEEGWTIPKITDDAMVLEYTSDYEIKMVEADYRNIKITTPEDLAIAGLFINEKVFEKN